MNFLSLFQGTRLYKRTYDAEGLSYEDVFIAGKTDSGGRPADGTSWFLVFLFGSSIPTSLFFAGTGSSAVFADSQIGQSGLAYTANEVYLVDYVSDQM